MKKFDDITGTRRDSEMKWWGSAHIGPEQKDRSSKKEQLREYRAEDIQEIYKQSTGYINEKKHRNLEIGPKY